MRLLRKTQGCEGFPFGPIPRPPGHLALSEPRGEPHLQVERDAAQRALHADVRDASVAGAADLEDLPAHLAKCLGEMGEQEKEHRMRLGARQHGGQALALGQPVAHGVPGGCSTTHSSKSDSRPGTKPRGHELSSRAIR